jgi:hypothetical protein
MVKLIEPEFFPTKPLWKFLSLASDQSPIWQKRLTQLAVEGKAYFSSPRDFNDPFDCLPHFPVPQTEEELERGKQHLINRMVKAMPDMPPHLIRQKMGDALSDISRERLVETLNGSVTKTSSNMGVFCLSETIDSVLMWSHYSSNHSGVALRFDFRIEPSAGIMPLFKVKYEWMRPWLGLFLSDDIAADIADALATKAAFWGYEQEWRALRVNAARTLVDFNPLVVTGVAFGATCASNAKREITSLLKGRPIEYFQVSSKPDTFDLTLQKPSDL